METTIGRSNAGHTSSGRKEERAAQAGQGGGPITLNKMINRPLGATPGKVGMPEPTASASLRAREVASVGRRQEGGAGGKGERGLGGHWRDRLKTGHNRLTAEN